MNYNTAFLGCIYSNKSCRAAAVALWSQTAGAEEPHWVQLRALGPVVFQFSLVLPFQTSPLQWEVKPRER